MVLSSDFTFSSPCQITFRYWGLGLQHLLGGYKSTSNSSIEIFILLYANTSVKNINNIRFTKEKMNQKNEVKVTQSCPTLCNPKDHTVHGIFQARILEWVAIPFSGTFPTQGLNPGLLHCRRILYQLSHREAQMNRVYHWNAPYCVLTVLGS